MKYSIQNFELRILADDLSGAADCAAAFAAPGRAIPLSLDLAGGVQAGAVAVDTDSRAMGAAAACAAVTAAVDGFMRDARRPVLLYKKIDSTLRGHIGAEMRAALDAAPSLAGVLVAPSFPEQGRTLRGGRLHVHGAAQAGPGADLPAVLAGAGLRAALLQADTLDVPALLQAVRDALAQGARAVVVDAASGAALRTIAQVLVHPGCPRLLVAGSAGLARAFGALAADETAPRTAEAAVDGDAAAQGDAAAARAHAPPHLGERVVGVVGSCSASSSAQVELARASGAARVLGCGAQDWVAPAQAPCVARVVAQATAALAEGTAVLFTIEDMPRASMSRSAVDGMARAVLPVLQGADALVLTGGDTARAVLQALGIGALHVFGELEPGISLSRERPDGGRWFAIKAGGFGDEGALRRALDFLHTSMAAA